MQLTFHIEGGNFTNAGFASSEVKKVLKKLNVDMRDIRRIVVALFEAEVNIVAHAYEGDIEVNISAEKVQMILTDRGPGIENIDQAMVAGYSTASPSVREMGFGAGMGLENIKKNSDEFLITSEVNIGTRLEITNHLKEA